MRKLLSALMLTMLLSMNALAADSSGTSQASGSSAIIDALVVVAIAIPNLLK